MHICVGCVQVRRCAYERAGGYISECFCAYMCASARVCVCVWVRVRVRACACGYIYIYQSQIETRPQKHVQYSVVMEHII